MTLQQLRVLVAVVEHGSFTRGAQAVYMTQSAASQHVRSLEQALGLPLVERTASAVLPTRAGEGLVRYAQEILRVAADAERYVLSLRQGRGGRVVVGASGSAVYLVPAIVSALRAVAPDVEVSLQVSGRDDLEEAVARGMVDVAVMSGPVRRSGLATEGLCPDRVVLAAAPGTTLLPAAALAPVPLARIADQPLIAPAAASPSWRMVTQWAEAQGVELRPTLRLESPDAIKKAVEAGLGVAFLSAWVIEREVILGTLRLVPVSPAPPQRSYELVRREGRLTDEPLATLLRIAPQYLRRRLPPGIADGQGGQDDAGAPFGPTGVTGVTGVTGATGEPARVA